MSLLTFNEDVMFAILSLLSIQDILSLRQVCASMNRLTRLKSVWISRTQSPESLDAQLPAHVGDYRTLDQTATEYLVRRLSLASQHLALESASGFKLWNLYLPQSITWLRLVHSRWLFVASSDDKASKLSCWDLFEVFAGNTLPVAEGFLPGRVKTGKLEVQGHEVVIALGLGPETRSTHVISLRKGSEGYMLVELSRVDQSTHVLMLAGDWIGVAIRGQSNLPHLVNWKAQNILLIPPPPGGVDVPGRRSVPHLITLWNDLIVIAWRDILEFYDFTSSPTPSAAYKGSIAAPSPVLEVHALPSDGPAAPLRLLVLTPRGVEVFFVDPMLLSTLWNEQCPSISCASSPQDAWMHEYPWYQLSVAPSQRQAFWLSAAHGSEERYQYPHVISTTIPDVVQVEGAVSPSLQTWTPDPQLDPALWALPIVERDEVLGITVIGNHFGELAIFDLARGLPFPSIVVVPQDVGIEREVTLSPTPIELIPSPRIGPTHTMPEDEFQAAIANWSQDGIVDSQWTNEWYKDRYSARVHSWSGVVNDLGWVLENAYGFPGEVLPQAYTPIEQVVSGDPCVLLRIGDRYIVEDEDGFVHSWSHPTTTVHAAQAPGYARLDAQSAAAHPPICRPVLSAIAGLLHSLCLLIASSAPLPPAPRLFL
uniref:F-box domain-containing protein n=1 Tax=Mycena chlorophos TaxID=658473 RepID=A0ABQ0KXY9_MYCCL|nr:predicted protein [Mycena chlorophos]